MTLSVSQSNLKVRHVIAKQRLHCMYLKNSWDVMTTKKYATMTTWTELKLRYTQFFSAFFSLTLILAFIQVMKTIFVWGCLMATLIEPCISDMYLHAPPGSNNRLNGNQDNVRNANRLFDSQVQCHYILAFHHGNLFLGHPSNMFCSPLPSYSLKWSTDWSVGQTSKKKIQEVTTWSSLDQENLGSTHSLTNCFLPKLSDDMYSTGQIRW